MGGISSGVDGVVCVGGGVLCCCVRDANGVDVCAPLVGVVACANGDGLGVEGVRVGGGVLSWVQMG